MYMFIYLHITRFRLIIVLYLISKILIVIFFVKIFRRRKKMKLLKKMRNLTDQLKRPSFRPASITRFTSAFRSRESVGDDAWPFHLSFAFKPFFPFSFLRSLFFSTRNRKKEKRTSKEVKEVRRRRRYQLETQDVIRFGMCFFYTLSSYSDSWVFSSSRREEAIANLYGQFDSGCDKCPGLYMYMRYTEIYTAQSLWKRIYRKRAVCEFRHDGPWLIHHLRAARTFQRWWLAFIASPSGGSLFNKKGCLASRRSMFVR